MLSCRALQLLIERATMSLRLMLNRARREVSRILSGMAQRPSAKKKSSMLANDFGKRLRALREQRGLTQRQLAERIEAQVPQISRYEAGGIMPNAETLIALSDVLRVGLDELVLGRDGAAPVSPIRDVRLLERMQELEKLDRRFRDTAIAVIDAIVVQGNNDAVSTRLGKRR